MSVEEALEKISMALALEHAEEKADNLALALSMARLFVEDRATRSGVTADFQELARDILANIDRVLDGTTHEPARMLKRLEEAMRQEDEK